MIFFIYYLIFLIIPGYFIVSHMTKADRTTHRIAQSSNLSGSRNMAGVRTTRNRTCAAVFAMANLMV